MLMFLWTLNKQKDDQIYCNRNYTPDGIHLQNNGYYLIIKNINYDF